MKTKRLLSFLSLLLLVFIIGCDCREATDTVIIKVASVLPSDHPSSKALEFFRDRLGEISAGKIEVRLFLNSQLGNATETIESCQTGNLEIVFASAAPLSQFVPELNALSMPFIFRDKAHEYAVLDGPIGKNLGDKLKVIDSSSSTIKMRLAIKDPYLYCFSHDWKIYRKSTTFTRLRIDFQHCLIFFKQST